ncbi:MFS transporter [Psychrosphaera sp. G1-22]|uniref:MFS transporter n=1 Tax=Psychrosphaera algicola TaxID=3023714 RepID=A0ABT5F9Y9_9GAMM|nr:MFS transporter [Psychrosphaera sp. G1-22]MDC2888353.1 MFS transporter [Psychrosphaera sp. G1-22]
MQPIQTTPTPVKQDLADLLTNKPWIILFALALIIMLTITLRGSSGTFYFKYFVGREDLIGAFSTAYMLSLMVGAALTPIMVKYIDKKQLLLILMLAVTVLSVGFFLFPQII